MPPLLSLLQSKLNAALLLSMLLLLLPSLQQHGFNAVMMLLELALSRIPAIFWASGYMALWLSMFAVWSTVYYAVTGRWVGAGGPGRDPRSVCIADDCMCACALRATSILDSLQRQATCEHRRKVAKQGTDGAPCRFIYPFLDAHKPYAWAVYLSLYAAYWAAYLAFMGLHWAKARVLDGQHPTRKPDRKIQ
jgi:hypothetical protein